MSARNRELATLLLAGLVASTAFASAWISGLATVDYGWLPWAALLGGIFLVAHLVARWTVPDADPTLLPLVALISAIGLVFVYRIEPEDGRRQLVWIAVGVAAFALVLFWLRYDYRVLERYKYVFGISAIVLLMLPSVPGLGQRVNGVKLWVDIGPLRFQPGEIAKIFLVIFLAGYLRDKREALARGRLKDFGPLLAIWGAAMLVLVQTSDLGSALLNFGIFLAMVYAATGRLSFVLAGLALFAGGSALLYDSLSRVQQRVTVWLQPWTDEKVHCSINGLLEYRQNCDSYQLVKSLYSIANGGYGGHRDRPWDVRDGRRDAADPVPPDRLRLLGDRAGAGPDRRGGGAAPVPRARRARDARRARGPRRVLEAPRGRAHVRLRPADVHHRRRRPAHRAADRHHAAVRLVRRLERRLELRDAGAAPARLPPRRADGTDVNRQLIRVGWTAMALIVALIVGTTYWQTWARPGLASRQDNEIQRVAEFQVRRGLILAPGRVLAKNRVVKRNGRKLYFRRYPQGRLAVHVVGYSTVSRARAGLEKSMNGVLTGTERNLGGLVERQLDEARGKPIVGDTVVTTLDLHGQQVALEQLGRTCGAVAAIDPRDGRLLVMASSPSYNPNLVENDFGAISKITAACRPAAPLVNRASQGLYPPGSTFKVVTASAALESNRFTPESEFDDPGYCIAYGKRVNNFDTSRPFGRLSLATALKYSVNSVFCNMGKALGAKRILDQAKKFGFYERPPLETPDGERYPSGLYDKGELWYPKRNSDVDAGRMAFGQERMLVTPLQMAMVAGAIGNAGILMRPHVVDRIVSPRGTTVSKTEPERMDRPVGPVNARDIANMMVSAVQGGTGTAAQISGYRIGGKTGTAETGVAGQNTTWFIAFAGLPGERPQVAIAVALERQSLTGGATAAPIARAVMEALLKPAANP